MNHFIIICAADLSVTFSASTTSIFESNGVLMIFVQVSFNGNLESSFSVRVISTDITTEGGLSGTIKQNDS